MFELKKISSDGVEAALQKADHYRLLNEPWQAESICRDVLRIDADNQHAIRTLVLALTDQFGTESARRGEEPRAFAGRLTDEYARKYYSGIICERRGMSHLERHAAGAGPIVYDQLRQAMRWYEQAEAIRPAGNEDSLLRWNTCARVIERHPEVRPAPESDSHQPLE